MRIASSSVVIASARSAFCASRKLLRSRAWPSSSSAARLTAPSASISRLSASISPCRPASLTPPSSIAARDRVAIGVGRVELLEVLRAAELRRLLLELQRADACRAAAAAPARGRAAASSARAQALRQVVVERCASRRAPPRARAASPARSAARPARRRRSGCASSSASAASAARLACELLRARSRSRARARARRAAERAQLELRLLRLRARASRSCVARRVERALGGAHRLVELGLALLGDAELARRAPRSAPRSRGAARAELGELARRARRARRRAARAARWSARRAASGAAARPASWCAARLRCGRVALARREMRCDASVLAASARTRRLRDSSAIERLRARLPVEVLDLLGARQQAGLLGVGRVEADRELADRVALARHDDFAVRQARARGERRVEVGRGVDAFEPVAEQRRQARVAEMQQVGEARQRAVRVRDRRRRRR